MLHTQIVMLLNSQEGVHSRYWSYHNFESLMCLSIMMQVYFTIILHIDLGFSYYCVNMWCTLSLYVSVIAAANIILNNAAIISCPWSDFAGYGVV